MEQRNCCLRVASGNDSDGVIAILHWPNSRHSLARQLKGVFSCLEAIDTGDLFDSAEAIGQSASFERAVAVIDFASMCLTKVAPELKGIRSAFADGRIPRVRKHSAQLAALLEVIAEPTFGPVERSLQAIRKLEGSVLYRRELLHECERALRLVLTEEAETLLDASWIVRNRTRRLGRRLPRCGIGSTLLVKGLQFDHAILLDVEGYDPANLYVALTRGSKSLTIVSQSRTIEPRQAPPKPVALPRSGVADFEQGSATGRSA